MRISKIEFENFRNFKEHTCLKFPTDGTVSVIYGTNGAGKTTLHQLFQWVFYGTVNFNKTATDKMYNLEFEREADYKSGFSVSGTIDFEHPNKDGKIEYYSLHREWLYRKEMESSIKVSEKVHLLKKVGDDWIKLSASPEEVIEQILPSGLSDYFFFDGENMIADLNVTGKESAKALKKALYSIFDLNLYEQALVHLGRQSGSQSTVLGRLYLSKSEKSTDSEVIRTKGLYNKTQNQIEQIHEIINKCNSEMDRYNKEIQELSEKIGSNPSRANLEKRRKLLKGNIKSFEENIVSEYKAFGKDVAAHYPYLFMSKIVEDAKLRIGLKVEEEKLIPGLTKEFLENLQKEHTCICGNKIGEKEIENINGWLKMFPPLSYKHIYDEFKRVAMRWSSEYDDELLISHMKKIFKINDQITACQNQIRDIDEEEKQSKNVDDLIAQRSKDEESYKYWNDKKKSEDERLGVQKQFLKQYKKKLDAVIENNGENKIIESQIEVVEAVRNIFESSLHSYAKKYSQKLCEDIQNLVDVMLTSNRKVDMTENFELIVKDSYNNESKSEGQFAIVSFAYIGGIFKLLKEVDSLKDKEFPLILDGPFSKLDVTHRKRVIDTIPNYAPQVILFSKDDINDCFEETVKKKVWTIKSNDDKNVSWVEEIYDPNIFKDVEGA